MSIKKRLENQLSKAQYEIVIDFLINYLIEKGENDNKNAARQRVDRSIDGVLRCHPNVLAGLAKKLHCTAEEVLDEDFVFQFPISENEPEKEVA